jgi:hypothetical protein
MKTRFRGIFFIILLIGLTFIGLKFILMSKSGLVEITVHNYGQTSEVYLVKSYNENNGCIEFVDTFGRNHKVCGSYTVSKW